MFEKYLEQKEQILAEQLNLSEEYVNLYAILFNPKIEQSFKVYFSAEVDWWIYEEQIARSSNQRFNIDDPKLNAFLKQLDELYKKNARFSSLTLPQVINSAVKTRLNMLCRPRTAIKWFVYRWEQTKTYHEIIKRLNYLFDNKYLADGFIEYVQRKQLIKTPNDLIPISEFDKIINDIDNEKIHSLNPEEFVQIMSPLFSFFNLEAEHKDTAKIPLEAVIIYFDDKNLFSLSTKLEQMFRSGELLLISKKYLLGFIYKSLYDADNLYGSDDDNITKVTKEIEQANSNYLNMALSLKENLSKTQPMPLSPEEDYYPEDENYSNETEIKNEFNFPDNFEINSLISGNLEQFEQGIKTENINIEEQNEFDNFDNIDKIIEDDTINEESTQINNNISIDDLDIVNNEIDNIIVEDIIAKEEIIAENITNQSDDIDLSAFGFDFEGDNLIQKPVDTIVVKPSMIDTKLDNTQDNNADIVDNNIDEEELIIKFTNSINSNKNKLMDILTALKMELDDY